MDERRRLMISTPAKIGPLVLLALSLLSLALDSSDAADTRTGATRTNSTRQGRKIDAMDWKCGSTDDLVARVDKCAEPLIDILAGRLKVWPHNDDEAMDLCEEFGFTERCIKEASRKCAKGIQKTIISTIATSVQRVRKRECSRSKASGIVKTTTCLEQNQAIVQDWMRTVVSRLSAIESQERAGEKKINAICCMVGEIEKEIKGNLDPFCPNEAKFIQRLFRGVIDSAVDIICRQPKCKDYLKGYQVNKGKDIDGLVALILKIVFSLDAAD